MQTVLFPEIKPYHTQYLNVSDLHQLWIAQYGNPEGMPVLWLHGGPGSGCSDIDARYFDPALYRIILLDQRGAGKSKPFGEMKENTTQLLVQDIDTLRRHLGIQKWVILGGSWGSALALAYAQAYPSDILGLILRGVFSGTKEESDHLWYGMRGTFPEAWQEFNDFIPPAEQSDLPLAYYKRIMNLDPAIHSPALRSFTKYDTICAYMRITEEDLKVHCQDDNRSKIGVARTFIYYCHNNFFLSPGQLINNVSCIAALPCIIVHGRYDTICQTKIAYDLHKKWPGSILRIIENGGHTAREPAVAEGVKQAAQDMYTLLHK